MPGLAVTLGTDNSPFEAGMKAALNIAAQTAAQVGAKWAVAATGIDKAMTQTARNVGVTFGREITSKITPVALGLAGVVAGFVAVEYAVHAVGEAAKDAQAQLASMVKIGTDARDAAVGTTFLQSLTGQAKALGAEVSTLTGMLDRAREASTVRIGEGDGEASSAILDRLKQNVAAGNLGTADLDRFTSTDSQEQRIRVILDLVEQLRAKGANLAALDLGGKMFGADFESKLRTGVDIVGAMRRALDGLQAGDQGRIIPPEEIQRAENLSRRIEEANRMLSEGLAPIQRDIALWQSQQLAGWVDIKEQIAAAAQVLGSFYEKVTSLGQYLSRLGNADIFKNLVAKLDNYGLIDHAEIDRINRTLSGGLEKEDKPAVPTDSDAGGPLKIAVKPKADTSHSLPSLSAPKSRAPSSAETSAIETFVGSLEKSAAAIRAEADAYGLSNAERQTAINLAKAEEVAKQNNVALTDQEIARIRQASKASAEYRDKLDDLRESQEFVRSTGGEFLTGIAQDARNGVGALDALGNAIGRLAARLEDKALNSLADLLFGKSGGNSSGIFGSILGSGGGFDLGLNFFGGGAKDGYVPKFAAGVSSLGLVHGPGSGTSDSILARISTGESIVTARATAEHRPLIEAMNAGRLPRFAAGGIVDVDAYARTDPSMSLGAETGVASRSEALAGMPTRSDGLTVNVHPPANTVPEVKKSRGAGGVTADVMIRQMIMEDFGSNGPLAQTMQDMYGLNRMTGRSR